MPYLGKPGSMQQLPSPNGPIDSSPSRGDSAVTLLSGGQSVIRRLNQKRTYSLPYLSLGSDDADQISAFYQGLYGPGPYVYVDASVRNVLPLDVATCGIRSQASPGWVRTSGTLTASGGSTSPVLGSGVLTWTTPASGASLHPGLVALMADLASAPVYLPGEAVTVSMWLKCSVAGTHTLVLNGYNAAGASLVTSTTPVALTTSFQPFSVSIGAADAGFAACAYVLPRLLTTAAALTFSVAAVQLEYDIAASNWQPGNGSPRVILTASPGRTVPQYGYSDHTLVLGEVG
jgi:hypothetical protein